MVAEEPAGTEKRLAAVPHCGAITIGGEGDGGAGGGGGGGGGGTGGGGGGGGGSGGTSGGGEGDCCGAAGGEGGGGEQSESDGRYCTVIAGRRPVGVPLASAAVLTTPPNGAVRVGAVVNEKPHRTASTPSVCA